MKRSIQRAAESVTPSQSATGDLDAVYAKIARRIIPFTVLLFLMAWLDRYNLGFAKLQMTKDLGFSEAVYGFGAGIVYVGYMLFEIPSNLLLERIGALSQPFADESGNEELRRALDTVPEDYALVLKLRFLDEMPLKRIAAFLGTPLSTVKWRVHQGKKLLRTQLESLRVA